MQQATFTCPHCGAEVPSGAESCPACGSDESTGWAEDADKWQAGIPSGYEGEDSFDYDQFVRREFGQDGDGRPAGMSRIAIAGILLLVFAALALVFRLRS